MSFFPFDFENLARIFIHRYGQPTRREHDSLVWDGVKVVIWLNRYNGLSLNYGRAYIALRTEVERQTAEQSKALKNAKDDL